MKDDNALYHQNCLQPFDITVRCEQLLYKIAVQAYSARFSMRAQCPSSEWFLLMCSKVQFNIIIIKTKGNILSNFSSRVFPFNKLSNNNQHIAHCVYRNTFLLE